MALFQLCDGDPLVESVMRTYHAWPLKVPREGVKPLHVVEDYDGEQKISSLQHLLSDDLPIEVSLSEYQLPNLSGKRSKDVGFEFGLQILGTYLAGFQLPSAAITAKLTQAQTLAFSFRDVRQVSLEPFQLGKELRDRRVDLLNPFISKYLGPSAEPLTVIDSIITSSDFELSFGDTRISALELDIPTLQGIVEKANADVAVTLTDERTLSFQGAKRLTFAFSRVEFYLDDGGGFRVRRPEAADAFIWLPEPDRMRMSPSELSGSEDRMRDVHDRPQPHARPSERPERLLAPRRVVLTQKPSLLEWDAIDVDD